MQLALNRVKECPFSEDEVEELKSEVVVKLTTEGQVLTKRGGG